MPVLIQATIDKYGYHPFKGLSKKARGRISYRCDGCGIESHKEKADYSKSQEKRNDKKTFCMDCSRKNRKIDYKKGYRPNLANSKLKFVKRDMLNLDFAFWDCDCGTKMHRVHINSVNKGRTLSCGCYKKDKWDNNSKEKYGFLIGKIIGNIKIINFLPNERGHSVFKVLCIFENCNNEFSSPAAHFVGKYITKKCRKCASRLPLDLIGSNKIIQQMNRRNAKKGFPSTDLSNEDIIEMLVNEPCHVMGCGILNDRTIKISGQERVFYCNSPDRIDNSIGYFKGNIRSSCVRHNMDRNNKNVEVYDEKLGERAIQTILHQYEDKLNTRTKNELKRLLDK